ncbi:MAG: ATP-binding protein [Elusimicrobiota bacterium]|nr:ATP-binding protein [Endomicrobiia bacterium]MDW8165347.1 ATP-binding protein [Elusimicrobiota bacterium]
MKDLEKLSQQEKERIIKIRERIKKLTEEIQNKKENLSAQILDIKPQINSTGVVSPSFFSEVQNMLLETIKKGYETILQEKEKIIQKLQKEIEDIMLKYEQLKTTQEQQIAKVSALSLQQDKSLLELLKKITELEIENKNLKEKIETISKEEKYLKETSKQDKIDYVISHMKLLTTFMNECLRYFRNPIGIIDEAFNLVKDEIDGHPSYRKIEVVQKEIYKIRDIIRTASERLKPPSTINLQKVDLKSIISFVLNKFEKEISFKNVEVSQEVFSSDKDLMVEADFQILSDIVSEVIQNSLESFFQLTNNKIIIKLLSSELSKKIVIEDNGCGIPEHLLPKVFELFFTTKFEQGHFGIGLFKAFWYIKLFNGKIDISSVFNKGTAVTLEFPVVD